MAEKRRIWKTRKVTHTYFLPDSEAHTVAQGGGGGVGSGQLVALLRAH